MRVSGGGFRPSDSHAHQRFGHVLPKARDVATHGGQGRKALGRFLDVVEPDEPEIAPDESPAAREAGDHAERDEIVEADGRVAGRVVDEPVRAFPAEGRARDGHA